MIVRTSDQILNASLTRLVNETSISLVSPGSIARTFYQILAEEFGYNYRIMDVNLSSRFISTAGGEALDLLGTLFGVTRTRTSGSISSNDGRIYFYLNSNPSHNPGTSDSYNTGESIVIPKGTYISTMPSSSIGLNPVTWRVTESAYINNGEHMVYVSVEPVSSQSSTIATGTMVNHDVLGYSDLYVYNRMDLEVDFTTESDTNYRYRIVNSINQKATGNAIAIRLAALGVDGVRDCKVIPLANGIGTVKVVIILDDPGGINSSTIYSNAVNAVRSVAAAGDLVFPKRPYETRVDITITLLGNRITSSIKTAAQKAVSRYIASLSIGESISPAKITSEAMSISANIQDIAVIDGAFLLGGTPSVFTKTAARDDEQFFPGDIVIL